MSTRNRRSKLRWGALGLALALIAGCATGGAAKKGAEAAQRGEWDAAVAYYREALANDPKRTDVQISLERAIRESSSQHVARAKQLEAQDQLAAAAAEYRLAIEFDPSNSLALTKAMEVERTMRDRAEAARPRTRMDEMRMQASAQSPIPRLDPRAPMPSLRYTSSAIRDILNAIGTATGIGVQYEQGIESQTSRPFSVDLAGHSLESAFNMVLSQNTLTYKLLDSKTIFVYVDSQTNRLKYEDQYQQTFYLSHADVAEVNQILNQMLTTTTTGSRPVITQNKTANAVVVRATAPMLGMIKNIVDGADKPRAEVLIDVTILEVSRTRLKDLGIDLSSYAIGFTYSPESAPAGGAVLPPTPPGPINFPNVGGGSSNWYATVPSVVVKFLEQDQKTRLLAKPQLRGRENAQLTLNLGDEIPVPQTSFLATATGGVNTQPQISYSYRPVGVNLAITPKVTYNDEIILDPILVNKSALGPNVDVAGQALPTFVTRQASVAMRLRDGESNLLAGLIGEQDRETARSFPGINRIPILRSIFGNVSGTVEQSDIVMIVTPHIIRSREITAEDLKPFYVGTANNLGAGTAPGLISQAPPPGPPPPPGQTAGGQAGVVVTGAPPPTGGTPPPAGNVPPPAGASVGQPPVSAAPPPTSTPTPPPASRIPGVVPVEPVTTGAPASAAPTAQIIVTLPTADLQMGGAPYTVPISITDVSDLGAVTVTITYDPKVVKVASISPGTFMQGGGITPAFVPKIDEAAGRVDIAVSRGGTAPGMTGTGLIAGLVFQAVGPGTSKISVTGTALAPTGKQIPLKIPAAGALTVK